MTRQLIFSMSSYSINFQWLNRLGSENLDPHSTQSGSCLQPPEIILNSDIGSRWVVYFNRQPPSVEGLRLSAQRTIRRTSSSMLCAKGRNDFYQSVQKCSHRTVTDPMRASKCGSIIPHVSNSLTKCKEKSDHQQCFYHDAPPFKFFRS